jgi:hypothetical protein
MVGLIKSKKKMKVVSVKKIDKNIYDVTLKPNWIEILIGLKEKTIQYRETDEYYKLTRGAVYVDRKGKELGVFNRIGIAIDEFKRSW